jgi:hypothetical protein
MIGKRVILPSVRADGNGPCRAPSCAEVAPKRIGPKRIGPKRIGMAAVVLVIVLTASTPAGAQTKHVLTASQTTVASSQGRETSSTWSIQGSPDGLVNGGGVFTGVSCTSSSACMTVGYYSSTTANATLAEAWNGTSWSTLPAAPLPTGNTDSKLEGVSCTSSDACTAVGSYLNKVGDYVTLAESWDGTAWSLQHTPHPSGSTFYVFDGVSCISSSDCEAVGDYLAKDDEMPLAESWNGTSWSIQDIRAPSGGSQDQVKGVSCTESGACTAVGSYVNSKNKTVVLVEAWNGTKWSLQSAPEPTGSRVAALYGVSCTSTPSSSCTAVGSSQNKSGNSTVAEEWNGTTWSVETTVNPSTGGDILWGVSCSTSDDCTAVGETNTDALVEAWDGSSWEVQTTPSPTGADLVAASCTSGNCEATGAGVSEALAEGWDGTTWSIEVIQAPFTTVGNALQGVSCNSSNACMAVGYYGNVQADMTLAEEWDGTSWTIESTPNPPGTPYPSDPTGSTDSKLAGVSCVSSSACIAVGNAFDESGDVETLAEAWNGTTWSIQTTPTVDSTDATLDSVSCSSPDLCEAVGDYYNGTTQEGLAEQWNGDSWTTESIPDPSGATMFNLDSVSCVSDGPCMAVGSYTDGASNLTVSEQWDGTSWTVEPTDNLPNGTFSSVSCTALNVCVAVGDDGNSPNGTFAASWNGTSWSTIPTPRVPGSGTFGDNSLQGVSCSSTTTCTAVGYYDSNGSITQQVTLAETWSGKKFKVQSTPDATPPTGMKDYGYPYGSIFDGVSCTSGGCTATGDSYLVYTPQTFVAAEP